MRAWLGSLTRRRRDESGYAAVLVAIIVATLALPLCAISVDVGRWYVELAKVQNAADAAATAGVTWLPDDFTNATNTALAVAQDNGYPNSGGTTVKTSVGAKPTQLVVTISTKVANQFGSSFGVPWTTVTRSSTADYNGPAPMGSPCNTFGNEPAGSNSSASDARGPSSSVIVTPTGGASCTSTPQFWAAIAGPDTPKANGDQYMTRTCSTGNDGCTGGNNDDFNPEGYFYIVRVAAGAVGQPVTLQIYDPAWVETSDLCTNSPTSYSSIPLRANMNPYATTDGLTRYHMTGGSESPNSFCTGDVLNGGTTPITTSFGLRSPTDTYQPDQGAPITTCEKQYPGYIQGSQSGQPDKVSSGHVGPDDGQDRRHHPTEHDQQQLLQRRPLPGLPPVGRLLHVHPGRRRRLLPPGPHERRPEHLQPRRQRWVRRERQGVQPDWRRHQRRRQRQQPVLDPGQVPDRQHGRHRRRLGVRVAEHVDLRQLLRLSRRSSTSSASSRRRRPRP